MKNAIIFGLVIGILSAAWMFAMHALGYTPQSTIMQPIEFASILIPLAGLYFGLRSYRDTDCGGQMGFLEALIQSFKIMIVGGIIAVAGSIIYIDEFAKEKNLLVFSGQIFGALLVGVLFALGFSVLLTTKSNKVD